MGAGDGKAGAFAQAHGGFVVFVFTRVGPGGGAVNIDDEPAGEGGDDGGVLVIVERNFAVVVAIGGDAVHGSEELCQKCAMA